MSSNNAPVDSLPVLNKYTRTSAELKLHQNAMEVIEKHFRNRETVVPKQAIQFVKRGDNFVECDAICVVLGLVGGFLAGSTVAAATYSQGLAVGTYVGSIFGGIYACKRLCYKETLTVGGMDLKNTTKSLFCSW